MTTKYSRFSKNYVKLKLYINIIERDYSIIRKMGVDVFGRRLVESKEVHRGPPGVGFTITASGDFDIENKLLCNVAEAQNNSDAVNLAQVKQLDSELLNNILRAITGMKADLKNEVIGNLKEEIKASLKGELNVDILKNTANIQHIECMIANGSKNCEKKVYSR